MFESRAGKEASEVEGVIFHATAGVLGTCAGPKNECQRIQRSPRATESGRVYRLEYKNSLADPNWTALPLVAGNGRMLQLTDPTATTNMRARFYRVRRW